MSVLVPPERAGLGEASLEPPAEAGERLPLFCAAMAEEGLGTTGVEVALEGATLAGAAPGREKAGVAPRPATRTTPAITGMRIS
jgi:hypothetical protein